MSIRIDTEVQRVLEFIEREVSIGRRCGVAEQALKLARVLWGGYKQMPVEPPEVEVHPPAANYVPEGSVARYIWTTSANRFPVQASMLDSEPAPTIPYRSQNAPSLPGGEVQSER